MKKILLPAFIFIALALLILGAAAIRNRAQNEEYVPIQDQEEIAIETEIDKSNDTGESIDETIDSIDQLLGNLEFDIDFEEVEDF